MPAYAQDQETRIQTDAEAVAEADTPAIIVTGLDDRKRRALIIADNKLALNAGWDEQALRVELEDLASDYGELMGFSEDELAALLAEAAVEEGLTDEDEVPEPPADPITKPGDLWLLGDHRLLCGDSTKAEDVERLMAGANVAVSPGIGFGEYGDTHVRLALDQDQR